MTGPEEKAKILNIIESKIEVITSLSIECFEHIYKAAWNEAIEEAAKLAKSMPATASEIRELKR